MDLVRAPGNKEGDCKLRTMSKVQEEAMRTKDGASPKRKDNDNSAFLPLRGGYHGTFHGQAERKGES